MKNTIKHITLYCIRIFLLVFWLYIALDKLWDLPQFHSALLRQPFPDWWSDILVWALPGTELIISLLFLGRPLKIEKILVRAAYLLSSVLLIIFTMYIGLGVIGFYSEKPCGCASIFSGLSWIWHLLVNILLLGISILGWYLTGPTAPIERYLQSKRQMELFVQYLQVIKVQVYQIILCRIMVFKMRFAPFPGRPVKG